MVLGEQIPADSACATPMNKLRSSLLLWLLLCLVGCANGANQLPYDSWRLGLGAPSYMEVWIETADAVDVHDHVFRRAMSGVAAINSPENLKGRSPWLAG